MDRTRFFCSFNSIWAIPLITLMHIRISTIYQMMDRIRAERSNAWNEFNELNKLISFEYFRLCIFKINSIFIIFFWIVYFNQIVVNWNGMYLIYFFHRTMVAFIIMSSFTPQSDIKIFLFFFHIIQDSGKCW